MYIYIYIYIYVCIYGTHMIYETQICLETLVFKALGHEVKETGQFLIFVCYQRHICIKMASKSINQLKSSP